VVLFRERATSKAREKTRKGWDEKRRSRVSTSPEISAESDETFGGPFPPLLLPSHHTEQKMARSKRKEYSEDGDVVANPKLEKEVQAVS